LDRQSVCLRQLGSGRAGEVRFGRFLANRRVLVKGLEFDYVVVADANAQTYASDLRSRHLLYVAVTRAAHQLWLLHCGNPSPLVATVCTHLPAR